jgi:hypothetical protein
MGYRSKTLDFSAIATIINETYGSRRFFLGYGRFWGNIDYRQEDGRKVVWPRLYQVDLVCPGWELD